MNSLENTVEQTLPKIQDAELLLRILEAIEANCIEEGESFRHSLGQSYVSLINDAGDVINFDAYEKLDGEAQEFYSLKDCQLVVDYGEKFILLNDSDEEAWLIEHCTFGHNDDPMYDFKITPILTDSRVQQVWKSGLEVAGDAEYSCFDDCDELFRNFGLEFKEYAGYQDMKLAFLEWRKEPLKAIWYSGYQDYLSTVEEDDEPMSFGDYVEFELDNNPDGNAVWVGNHNLDVTIQDLRELGIL